MIVLHDDRIALLGHTIGDGGVVDPSFLLEVLRADGTALDATVGEGSGYVQSQFVGEPCRKATTSINLRSGGCNTIKFFRMASNEAFT
jgi:hypothetical protein